MNVDVLEYKSYRELLQAVFEARKAANPALQFYNFAESLGFSKSGLYLVISGKRDLGVQKIHEIATALHFSQPDREHFEAMVLKEQAKTEAERLYYSGRVEKLRQVFSGKRQITHSHLPILYWFVPALIVALNDYVNAKDEIAVEEFLQRVSKAKAIPLGTLRQVVQALQRNGFIPSKEENAEDCHYVVAKSGNEEAIREFLGECLDRAKASVPDCYVRTDVKYFAEVFSLDEKNMVKLHKEIAKVIERFKGLDTGELEQPSIFQAVCSVVPVFRNSELQESSEKG
jgi:uncharacterized protein (TIGR02147 family)